MPPLRHYWFRFPTKQAAKLFLVRLRKTDTGAQFDLRPEGARWLGRVSTTRDLDPELKLGRPSWRLIRSK